MEGHGHCRHVSVDGAMRDQDGALRGVDLKHQAFDAIVFRAGGANHQEGGRDTKQERGTRSLKSRLNEPRREAGLKARLAGQCPGAGEAAPHCRAS